MIKKMIHRFFHHIWGRHHLFTYMLLPFSWLFQILIFSRRAYYRLRQPSIHRVPVIVVGNITVGGTGKTPVVMALATFLKEKGYHPGIVMRGYQGHFKGPYQAVSRDSDPFDVGEEAVLIARTTACPVMVGQDRAFVSEQLLSIHHVDIIISDDGLQHYALARDIEIVVVDKKRLWGNGFCLPAGPLREPISRLKTVDYVLVQEGHLPNALTFHKQLCEKAINLANLSSVSLSHFVGQKVHAVAGIGDPESFFSSLRAMGILVIVHAFPDHHWFSEKDLKFKEPYPILMTEKDAVKCARFTHLPLWSIPMTIELPEPLQHNLLRRIASFKNEERTLEVQLT